MAEQLGDRREDELLSNRDFMAQMRTFLKGSLFKDVGWMWLEESPVAELLGAQIPFFLSVSGQRQHGILCIRKYQKVIIATMLKVEKDVLHIKRISGGGID